MTTLSNRSDIFVDPETMTKQIRVATDIGGTFTDIVYYEVDEAGAIASVNVFKGHTTPLHLEEGVMSGIEEARLDVPHIDFFAHGTTVVINALTERKGVRTGLITTRGFRDVLEIGRGNRPDFFNLRFAKPSPFVPRYLRREVTERVTHRGDIHTPLEIGELDDILESFRAEGVEAIAICLLHAYANPEHERKLLDQVRRSWPEISVVASHQISREWREYERTSTTVLSAYVQPIAAEYLERLETRLDEKKFQGNLYIMQSNGGIDTVEAAKQTPITMVESGPASGVLGAAILGKQIGEANIIALDIGGTTAKCSLIADDHVQITSRYMVERTRRTAGYPVMTPVVDIVEIGNGGGSIAWVDEDGKLRVGPESAGAVPGPVAYGQGGDAPTTTDANLLTGRINPDNFLGGEISADMNAVRQAFVSLGDRLGLGAEEAARGVIRIANHNMRNALKLVSINRGHDPRDFVMVAFGGGGAMHATALASELRIPRVIIPANSAVFSAWGMLMSNLRRDYVRTRPTTLNDRAATEIHRIIREMEGQALEEFGTHGIEADRLLFERGADMRYDGQEHSVRVALPAGGITSGNVEDLLEKFHATYESEYTYRLPNQVQLVSYHLVAFADVDRPPMAKIPSNANAGDIEPSGRRTVDFDEDGTHETTIWDRNRLVAGSGFDGPAIIEEPASTTVIFPDQSVTVDEYANLHVTIRERQT